MKTILTSIVLFFALISFSQSKNYLGQLFFDSISKDDFLISQKYSDISSEGFVYTEAGSYQKVNLTEWVYKQDFKQYQDTSLYYVSYERMNWGDPIKNESIVIYDKKTGIIVREFLNSYYPNSNIMSSLHDSELDY